MGSWGFRPAARAVAGLAVAASAAGAALASEVPSSAVSASLLTPPELLDLPYLAYQYPQRAAGEPSQAWVTAGTYSSIQAVGALFGAGPRELFVLSQNVEALGSIETGRLLQVGGAWDAGPVRIGIAVRGVHESEEDGYRIESPDQLFDDRSSEVTYRRGEVALGLGIGGEESYADVVFQLFREELEGSLHRTSRYDTVSLDLHPDFPRQSAVALRVGFPLARDLRIRAAAAFEERSAVYDVESMTSDVVRNFRTDRYGHAWSVGVAVEREVGPKTATVFARYGNRRGPPSYNVGSSSWTELDEKDELVQAGISLRQPIWEDIELMAAFETQFDVTRGRKTYFGEDVEQYTETREALAQSFAWGVRRRFETFDLAGSMRTNLSLSDPFLAVDARFRL